MAQYNTLNVKLSNSQLNKLKSGIKKWYWSNFDKLSSNVVADSVDENDFPQKLLLTNRQISKLCNVFSNNILANMKLSKTQLHKIRQEDF